MDRATLENQVVAKLFPPTRVLPDGTLGFRITRRDDCLRAAVATCLQVSPDEVPDPDIDFRLALHHTVAEITTLA